MPEVENPLMVLALECSFLTRTRDMLTVVERCGAGIFMPPSFVIYKGTALYMGKHSATNDPNAVFAGSVLLLAGLIMGSRWTGYNIRSVRQSSRKEQHLASPSLWAWLISLSKFVSTFTIHNNIQPFCSLHVRPAPYIPGGLMLGSR